ncbi:MAG: acyl-CoA thioesterase II [Chloroflexi bacterium]|nr:acyl-CoA thioesterase II [Chloroflexota bacterium]
MSPALEALVELLDLEPLEVNLFRGVSPDEDLQRVFGGQVAGQALVAAGRTVESDHAVHSLQAYFLRPGDPTVPIIYEVDRIRDGRSFTTRRVVAVQHGRAIFNLQASFHVAEDGPEHQMPMPDVAPPDELPTYQERIAPYLDQFGPETVEWLTRERPIDTRPTELPSWLDHEPRPPNQEVWIRTNGSLVEDPLLHACVVVYASDLTILDTAMLPHGVNWAEGRFMVASLDHAIWFHHTPRIDDWLLYSSHSPIAHAARALINGQMHRRDGTHVLSVTQEGLIRVPRQEPAG